MVILSVRVLRLCLSTTPLVTFRLKNKGFQKTAGEMAWHLGVSTEYDAVRHFEPLVISVAESSRVDLKKVLTGKLCYLKVGSRGKPQK